MSSIIKALKKAEEDRRRNSHQTPDFLSGRGKPGPLLPLMTVVVLGAILIGLLFYWTLKTLPTFSNKQNISSPNMVVDSDQQKLIDSPGRQKRWHSEPVTSYSLGKNDFLVDHRNNQLDSSTSMTADILHGESLSANSSSVKEKKQLVNNSKQASISGMSNSSKELLDVNLSPGQAVFECNSKIENYKYDTLDNPPRLFVDLYGVIPKFKERSFIAESGFKTVRIGTYDDKTRLVFDASQNELPKYSVVVNSSNIVVTWTATMRVKSASSGDKIYGESLNRDGSFPGQVETKLPDGVSLQLSEIFYEGENTKRMAVINGLPVMIGSRIDSAVIKEIHQDSVLVSIDDKLYSISPISQ